MNDLEYLLVEFSQNGIWVLSLIIFRIGAAMALLPAFGEMVTPVRVKLAATLAFTMVVAPGVWVQVESALLDIGWGLMVFLEVVAGLIIGALFRLLIMALQIAGTVAAQSTSLSQLFGGGLGPEPQPAISTVLFVGGLTLAIMAGLHLRVVEVFVYSFELFKPGVPIFAGDLSSWGVEQVSHSFALGFSLAGPFVLVSLVYNLALGAINRAMPQLMVAFVGAPAISFGGLVLLMLAAPLMLTVWLRVFLDITDRFGTTF